MLDFKLINHHKGFPNHTDVPNEYGIYAWFYDFAILRDFVDSREKFQLEVQKIIELLKYPVLKSNIQGNLYIKFGGELRHNVDKLSDKFENQFETEESRHSFVKITEAFAPLANPLYIGIATNLRKRYDDHLKDYNEALKNDSGIVNKFGSRLAERRISPSNLVFGCIPMPKEMASNVQQVEFFLNRIFHPILGVR